MIGFFRNVHVNKKMSRFHLPAGIFEKKRIGFNVRLFGGFTLVELLVVISILVVISGVGYSSYRAFQRRQVLEGAVKQVKADLVYARELASVGRLNTIAASCTSLEGYMFRRVGGSSYRIDAVCDSGLTCHNVLRPTYCLKTVTLPNNVTVGTFDPQSRFYFGVLGGGTFDKDGNPIGVNVTINLTYNSETKNIIVTKDGEIHE